MHVPLIGVLLVPLNIVVFFFWPSRLEELLIYMAIFQAASVLNLGGGFAFGLAPYFFTASLLAVRVALRWREGMIHFQRGEFAQSHLRLVVLFTVWCVLSALLFPILFDGIPVDSPRAGAESVFYLALPLRWSFSNAGQAGYIVLNFFTLLAFTDFVAVWSVKRLADAFSYSGAVVIIVGFYQMLSFRFGVPFPTTFFNSNQVWAQNYNQMIGADWHRVSSTFVEPSAAGGFLSAWLLFELIMANWSVIDIRRHWILASLGCVVLLATTSSTAYITTGLIVVLMVARLTLEAVGRNRILIRTGMTVLTMLIAIAAFLVLGHGASLLDAVLWHKSESNSAVVRMATVWRAVDVMRDTYGLGAGLGSNRAFGALAYIGSNLGILGLVAFSYLVAQLFAGVIRGLKLMTNEISTVVMIASAVGLFAHLVGSLVSGAEISDPALWVLWGLVLASVRSQGLAVASESGNSPRMEMFYRTVQ